jgi:hypothetical protein
MKLGVAHSRRTLVPPAFSEKARAWLVLALVLIAGATAVIVASSVRSNAQSADQPQALKAAGDFAFPKAERLPSGKYLNP